MRVVSMEAGEPSKAPITELLRLWSAGDKVALDRLTGLVYTDLRRIARLRRFQRADSSIQPTLLVNEVYIRLVGADPVAWRDRALLCHCRTSDAADRGRCSAFARSIALRKIPIRLASSAGQNGNPDEEQVIRDRAGSGGETRKASKIKQSP